MAQPYAASCCHTPVYKTSERYAKFGADHLAGAVRAIDGYFADLCVPGLWSCASCVLIGSNVGI
jgi:hypothetical protein